jgi:hypothetical protein
LILTFSLSVSMQALIHVQSRSRDQSCCPANSILTVLFARRIIFKFVCELIVEVCSTNLLGGHCMRFPNVTRATDANLKSFSVTSEAENVFPLIGNAPFASGIEGSAIATWN